VMKSRFLILGVLVIICWLVVIFDFLASQKYDLIYHGIIPRTPQGLLGIIFAPFIQSGFSDAIANTIGIIILGSLLMLRSLGEFVKVSVFVMVVGGMGTWIIGRNASHIGAGGVLFGWFGFLLITPFFERPIAAKSIIISVVAGLIYGTLIFGVIPGTTTDVTRSWEMSLCGFISGVLYSLLYYKLYIRWFKPKYLKIGIVSSSSKKIVCLIG